MRIALFVFSFFILINANAHQLNSYYQQLDSAVHLTKAGNLKLALQTMEAVLDKIHTFYVKGQKHWNQAVPTLIFPKLNYS